MPVPRGSTPLNRTGTHRCPPVRATLLLVGALLLVACSPEGALDGTDETPEPAARATPTTTPGVLYAFARQPSAITPAAAVEADDVMIVDQLFDGLTAVGADLEVVPAVAREWETDEDAVVHTFHLREDATFHDGSPVTADSFVRAWERIADRGADPPSAAHHLLDVVEGIGAAREGEPLSGAEALDEHTLRVTLNRPFAELPALVSHPALAPLPDAAATAIDFDRMPIGNGPFQMVEQWQPGQFVRMEPFAEHPDANTTLDQLVFRIYEGEAAAEDAYEDFGRGRLHLAPVPDAELREAVAAYGTAAGGAGPGVVRGERLMTVYYAFNVETPPFDDPAVRRAVARSIDRDAVVEATDPETRAAATSLVPRVLPGYEPAACGVCGHDPEEARRIIEENEIELEPFTLTVHDGGDHPQAAEQVRRDVEAALGEGMLQIRTLTPAEWLEEIRGGETGFFLSGWIAEYPSPGAFLDPLLHPSRIGVDNLSRYADPEVSDWLEEARATVDRAERYDLYGRVEERVLEDAPLIPLYRYRHARVVSDRAPGVVIDPTGHLDLTDVVLTEED